MAARHATHGDASMAARHATHGDGRIREGMHTPQTSSLGSGMERVHAGVAYMRRKGYAHMPSPSAPPACGSTCSA